MRQYIPVWPFVLAGLVNLGCGTVVNNRLERRKNEIDFPLGVNGKAASQSFNLEAWGSDSQTRESFLVAQDVDSLNKTVLLNDGEAGARANYIFILSPNEMLTNITLVSNDTNIITESSTKQRGLADHTGLIYNITTEFAFSEGLGPADFTLTVSTNTSTYIANGYFHVAGITAMVMSDKGASHLVSGIGSTGLHIESTNYTTSQLGLTAASNTSRGQQIVPLSFYPATPDSNQTLSDLVEGAKFDVKNAIIGKKSELIEFDAAQCNPIQAVTKRPDGSYTFSNAKCGLGYDKEMQAIVIDFKSNREGKAILYIDVPRLAADGESFETLININVGVRTGQTPVLVMLEDREFFFDYYGTETYTMEMYNTLSPPQHENATQYLMDLPNGRYATMAYDESALVNPVQTVQFFVPAVGSERPHILRLLARAMQNTTGPDAWETKVIDINAGSLFEEGAAKAWMGKEISIRESSIHESHAYVLIPPAEGLTRAVNTPDHKVFAKFGPSTLAIVQEPREPNAVEDQNLITMKIALEGYAIGNFSEYKSQQISTSVAEHIFNVTDGTVATLRLSALDAESPRTLKLTYTGILPSKNTSVVRSSLGAGNYKEKLSREILLNAARVQSSVDFSGPRTTHSSLTSEDSKDSIAAKSAALFGGAIALIALMVAIPLTAACFGLVAVRRRQQEYEESTMPEVDAAGIAGGSPVPKFVVPHGGSESGAASAKNQNGGSSTMTGEMGIEADRSDNKLTADNVPNVPSPANSRK